MAIVKKEYVIKLMREKELPYFQVTDGRVLIAENNEENAVEAAIQLLEEAFEFIEDNHVVVRLSARNKRDKAKGGSNWGDYEFKVNLRNRVNGIGGEGSTLIGYIEKVNELQRKIEQQANETRIKALEEKLAAVGEGKGDDVFTKWIPVLQTYLQNEKNPPIKGSVGIAGTEDAPIAEDTAAKQTQIRTALKRLAKVDQNLSDTLTILADFAEKKPSEYISFIPVVKGMI